MSYRFMRVLVLFDLPVLTGDQRREYARFRKFFIEKRIPDAPGIRIL